MLWALCLEAVLSDFFWDLPVFIDYYWKAAGLGLENRKTFAFMVTRKYKNIKRIINIYYSFFWCKAFEIYNNLNSSKGFEFVIKYNKTSIYLNKNVVPFVYSSNIIDLKNLSDTELDNFIGNSSFTPSGMSVWLGAIGLCIKLRSLMH